MIVSSREVPSDIVAAHGGSSVVQWKRLGGEFRPVGPGDLVITPLNGRHGIANVGDTDLDFLVIEVHPPAFAATDAEICLFVIDGRGTVSMGDNVARMDTGVGVTLMKDSAATVSAERPMQPFAAWLTV